MLTFTDPTADVGRVLSAFFACVGGAIMLDLGSLQFILSDKPVHPSDLLALSFALSVGLSLSCRPGVLFPNTHIALAAIVAGSAALAASGILEIVRGTLGVTEEDSQYPGRKLGLRGRDHDVTKESIADVRSGSAVA